MNWSQSITLGRLARLRDKSIRCSMSVLLPQEVASRFGVSERTARNDLQTLTNMGKLKKVAINKKQTGFIIP